MNRLIRNADSAEDAINTPGQATNQVNTQTDNQTDNTVEKQDTPDNKELQIAIDLLKRVGNSANDIKDAYYSLLDNLNALNSNYQNVYTEFKQLVKLPDQKEIEEIVQLQKDTQDAVKYLAEPDFLKGFMR